MNGHLERRYDYLDEAERACLPPALNPYRDGDEEPLWHRVKAYIRNPVGPSPAVTCPICQVHEVKIKLLSDVRSATTPGGIDFEPGLVLPCGHMTGASCMSEWIHSQRRRGFSPTCPVCNFNLSYRDTQKCQHPVRGILAPAEKHHDLDRVPPTIPEGGTMPLSCNDCRTKRTATLAQKLGETIWNPYGELEGDIPPLPQQFVHRITRDLEEQMAEERRPSWADKRDYLWTR